MTSWGHIFLTTFQSFLNPAVSQRTQFPLMALFFWIWLVNFKSLPFNLCTSVQQNYSSSYADSMEPAAHLYQSVFHKKSFVWADQWWEGRVWSHHSPALGHCQVFNPAQPEKNVASCLIWPTGQCSAWQLPGKDSCSDIDSRASARLCLWPCHCGVLLSPLNGSLCV